MPNKSSESARNVEVRMFGGEVYNATGGSMIEQLRDLTQMKNDGALTADEFAKFKDKLVNAPIPGACARAWCVSVCVCACTHTRICDRKSFYSGT